MCSTNSSLLSPTVFFSSKSGTAGSINIQDNAAYGTSHIRSKKPEETSGTEHLAMDPLSHIPTDVPHVYESVN